MIRIVAIQVAVFVAALSSISAARADAYDDLLTARKAFDVDTFDDAQKRLTVEADKSTDNYAAQLQAAESLRLKATWLRNERVTLSLESKEDTKKRDEQAVLGKAGIDYAKQAIELAKNDAEKAQASRVLGELYSHRITGMVSGMRNGPRAKNYIKKGLALAPDDPECKRSIALMYLHNPSFNGGDVPRAIKSFEECSELAPKSDIYPVLLAMAYRKAKESKKAEEAARRALELNPANKDAKALLKALQE